LLDKKVAAALITAATTSKKATETAMHAPRLAPASLRASSAKTEWNKCKGEGGEQEKAQLALMKGQVAWHKTAMRLVFPKGVDLFFSYNEVARELISMKQSVIEVLQAASTMRIPDAPPSQLLKLVSLPKIGTQTADRAELEKAFAAKIAAVGVEAIAAATSKAAPGVESQCCICCGASSALAEFVEMAMPAIGHR
jgi:hypothetical protein